MNNKVYSENNILKALMHFAIPGVLCILVAELYNMVDTFFVGKYVGAQSIGALSVVFPIQRLIIAFSMCISIGVSNMISRKLGEKNKKAISKYVQSVNALTIILILFITVVVYFYIDKICFFLGARDEIYIHAVEYLKIVIFGSIFLTFTTVFGYINIAFGNVNIMLLSSSVGAIINAIVDYILVRHYHMGVKGAAIATVLSQVCSFILAYFFIIKLQKEHNFKMIPKVNLQVFKTILAIGFSSFIIEFSDALLITVLNHLLLPIGGNDAIILVGVVTKVSMFMYIAIVGVSSSMQPLISYNYGAKNFKKVKKIVKTGFSVVVILSSNIWIYMLFRAQDAISIFLKDKRLLSLASSAFKKVILVFPILSFYYVCIYFFQSVGKERYNFILSIYRESLLYIPIVIIMVSYFGVLGAWITYPIVDIISAVTGVILLYRSLKEMDKNV